MTSFLLKRCPRRIRTTTIFPSTEAEGRFFHLQRRKRVFGHYITQKRKPIVMTSFLFNVVLGGFEPPQTEPKPVVLPLHHRTMWMQSYNFLQKQPNETAFFLDPRNDYAVLRGQKKPFISLLSIFQNINFH